MTPTVIIAIVASGFTIGLNCVALIVFIVKLSTQLENLTKATDKLANAAEKMDEKLHNHDVRLTVLEKA